MARQAAMELADDFRETHFPASPRRVSTAPMQAWMVKVPRAGLSRSELKEIAHKIVSRHPGVGVHFPQTTEDAEHHQVVIAEKWVLDTLFRGKKRA